MSGIVVPEDRAVNQPAAGFCRNPKCRDKSTEEFTFEVKHDRFACPKCGADSAPMVGLLVLTHLLVPEKDGPIKGKGGLTYRIGCDQKRSYLATVTNQEAATDNPKIANCPGCLAAAEKLGIKTATGWAYTGVKTE